MLKLEFERWAGPARRPRGTGALYGTWEGAANAGATDTGLAAAAAASSAAACQRAVHLALSPALAPLAHPLRWEDGELVKKELREPNRWEVHSAEEVTVTLGADLRPLRILQQARPRPGSRCLCCLHLLKAALSSPRDTQVRAI